ncbi:hypothetical protein [Saccharothrix variisporea]|uniref:Uncharacterized protein n=1 Tax=Saccharothrix variisporea TaxID=543527 RepID=A0A495XGJ8_9PSEU|nr:hypothetical protein [Saccharothrix variisporea]RKT72215.1 hypothetical protein DFJ66_5523 [Saccharothrix variisporea]
MQRPTTSGRRHNRTGSVSVAELIRKQRTPLRIPSPEQAATQGLVTELLGEPVHRSAPPPSRRGARIAGLVTGVLVLLTSVAAVAVLAGQRAPGPERPRPVAPREISGSSALRPDVLSAELGGGTGPAVPDGADAPAELVPMAADELEAPSAVPPPSVATGPNPQVDVVRRFYELLPAKPAEAARLLSPELVGGSARDFVTSWDRIQAMTIESTTARPDGSVLAVVSMQERTGRWMRVEQVFWLTDTSQPRIIATRVLSAQRS